MSKHYTTNDIISEKAISMGETNQDNIQGNGKVCPITTYTIHSNICPDKLLNTSPVYSVTNVIHELNPSSSVPSSKTIVKTSICSSGTSNGKINLSTISNYNTNSATNVTIPSCTKQRGNIISSNVGNSKNIDQSAYIIPSQNNCIPFYTLQKNSFYKPAYRPQLSLSCQPSPNISYNRTFSNDINNDLVRILSNDFNGDHWHFENIRQQVCILFSWLNQRKNYFTELFYASFMIALQTQFFK
ncbi:hypothetical protein Smp_180270 [Schistosoma mansoni]|uniref:hypothetical protein n=1 Tax=Schistosoma mansoni TaxID=6183 RepID=UPI00022DC520|nr:hypothetical protein Smp_180270 [Schistosoma mansoni]|eukprot:XP_018648345.1 hypothetical protein Smp_180270 [Schistosoma mansoni]